MKTICRLNLLPVILMIFLPINPSSVSAQMLNPGPQDLSFFSMVDETDQPYAIYLPDNFDETKKYPLVVFLHGAMSNHRLGLRRVFGMGNIQGPEFTNPGFIPEENDLEVTRYFPNLKSVDFIVAAPYARGTAGYQGIPEQDVMDMISDIKDRFLIDEDRMYLTGLSMGGGGTLWIGLSRPDMWAAIAPVCPAPPNWTEELAGNAANLPVHLFVGDQDFLHETALNWKSKFDQSAKSIEFIEYPGIGHNSWEYAYADGFIFDWFSQFKKENYPDRVVYSTRYYKYNSAYWVTLDKLIPGKLATIKVQFDSENTLMITTENLEGFSLNLTNHPKYNPFKKLTVKINGISIATTNAKSFMIENGKWVNKKYAPRLNNKSIGAEGPAIAALQNNHVYIYGTIGNASDEELQRRQEQAKYAANWSEDRGMMGRIHVFPRYMADNEIRKSDYDCSNLVLFGTKETNEIIKKFAETLPMHLKNDASGYGLIYIYPMNGKYILINSGLSWWIPIPSVEEGLFGGGTLRVNPRTDVVDTMPDYVLFKDNPGNVICSGYFNSEWQITPEDIDKLKLSGAVDLK